MLDTPNETAQPRCNAKPGAKGSKKPLGSDGPYLRIVEEPASKSQRFRYGSEGHTGCLMGVNSTPTNKVFPTVELVGFQGKAVVVASCVTMDEPPRPHPFKLVGKDADPARGISKKELQPDENRRIVYSNLSIQCVKKKEVEESLRKRADNNIDPFNTERGRKIYAQDYDLGVVRIAFQAFIFEKTDESGKPKPMPLTPIVTKAIQDKRASDLKICMICSTSCPAAGNSQLILLCDKVNKSDIKIRFFEGQAPSDGAYASPQWEAFGEFEPVNVFKQMSIAFRTPPYRDTTITEPRTVYVQLYRPSDGMTSDSIEFQYIPAVDSDPMGLRRKRMKSSNDPQEMLRKFSENFKIRPIKTAIRRVKVDNIIDENSQNPMQCSGPSTRDSNESLNSVASLIAGTSGYRQPLEQFTIPDARVMRSQAAAYQPHPSQPMRSVFMTGKATVNHVGQQKPPQGLSRQDQYNQLPFNEYCTPQNADATQTHNNNNCNNLQQQTNYNMNAYNGNQADQQQQQQQMQYHQPPPEQYQQYYQPQQQHQTQYQQHTEQQQHQHQLQQQQQQQFYQPQQQMMTNHCQSQLNQIEEQNQLPCYNYEQQQQYQVQMGQQQDDDELSLQAIINELEPMENYAGGQHCLSTAAISTSFMTEFIDNPHDSKSGDGRA